MRTFIAIEIPTGLYWHLQQFIQHVQGELKEASVADLVRWTPVNNLHLTLRFLGETMPEQVKGIEQALRQQFSAQRPLHLQLLGLGCFPNLRQPNIVWIGFGGDLQGLQQVQHKVEQIVQSVGFVAEEKSFKPHLTVGRVNRNASSSEVGKLGTTLQQLIDSQAISNWSLPFSADPITFMQSELRPQGPIYTRLATVRSSALSANCQ